MNTRARIMGLAALPLAGLLATGGAALAQTAGTPADTQVVQTAGTPAGTQVVQQAVTHRAGGPCLEHAVKSAAQQPGDQQRVRDRDRDGTCDHQARTAQTADRTMEHARDGSCVHDADR